MNNKGFTLVELIVSFILVSIIVGLILQIAFSLNKASLDRKIRTDIIAKQSILMEKINSDLLKKELKNIKSCGKWCLNLTFMDDSIKEFSLNKDSRYIKYGSYATILDKSINIGDFKIELTDVENNHLIKIMIELKSNILDKENFNVEGFYLYNSLGTLEVDMVSNE